MQTSVDSRDQVAELVRDALGHRAGDLDHAVLDQRLARDRHGLDRHLGVGEDVERDAEGARGAHAPARAVVAEDHRAVHVREPARRLAQAAVEGVAATGRPRRARAARRTSRARRCGPSARWERCGSPSCRAERYSPSRRADTGEVEHAPHGGRRAAHRERPAVALGREVGVHQRRQPGRVHERDLGEVERRRRGPDGAGGAASRPAPARWRCPARHAARAGDPRGGRRPP